MLEARMMGNIGTSTLGDVPAARVETVMESLLGNLIVGRGRRRRRIVVRSASSQGKRQHQSCDGQWFFHTKPRN